MMKQNAGKVTVVMAHSIVARLDALTIDIRLKSGVVVHRSQLIEAFIEASIKSPVSIPASRTELAAFYAKQWGKR